MKCIVTGTAGFVGSHLCEELLRQGHQVVGLDALIPNYPEIIKQRNLISLLAHPNFRGYRADLRADPLDKLLDGAEVVFHLAAMPGLLRSWSEFDLYLSCNVLATQRLLEAVRTLGPRLKQFIYVSTSSVYGRYSSGDETLPTKPISPYGATKLAAEKLCEAYADAYDLPLVILRYFSVYGPRQRPGMGYYRFIHALLHGEPLVVFGDGEQIRGNTYVTDCVQATVAAMHAPRGEIYNIGGGESASVWGIIQKLEALSGLKSDIRHQPARMGDQQQTLADTSKVRGHLGWQPAVSLDEGLTRQWAWQKQAMEAGHDIPLAAGEEAPSLSLELREDGRQFVRDPHAKSQAVRKPR